jgi:hypothetical protein
MMKKIGGHIIGQNLENRLSEMLDVVPPLAATMLEGIAELEKATAAAKKATAEAQADKLELRKAVMETKAARKLSRKLTILLL